MFRPNVKLVLEPGAGARIVDEVHQRTLTLTPTEGRILALIGPGTTTDSLAAAAKGAGIDVEAAQVEALLSRLRANELIDFTPSPGKLGPVALLPDDVVPAFRSDLHVAAAPKPGLMLVTDKKRDRSFTLYDFEVHIARLLDGRHRVTQVIELAGRIGIPITPESLGKFISQMKAYGFIAESAPVAPPAEDPTWPSRSEWSSEIRELYQSALRQFRLGRPGHAIEYLDALVEIRPDTPEAIELKKRVEASLDSGPVMEVSFEDLHGVEEPMPELTAAADVLTGGGPQLTMPAAALGEKPLSPSGTASALKPPPAPEGPRLATIALPPPAASAPSPAPSAPVALGDMLPTPSGKSRALGERFTKPFTLGEASFAKPAEGGAAKPGESAADLAPKPSAPRLTDEIAPLALPVAPKPSAPIYGKPIFGRPLEKPAEPKPSPIFSKPVEPEAAPKPPAPLFSKPAEPEAAPKPPAPLFSKPAEPEAAPRPPAPLFSKPARRRRGRPLRSSRSRRSRSLRRDRRRPSSRPRFLPRRSRSRCSRGRPLPTPRLFHRSRRKRLRSTPTRLRRRRRWSAFPPKATPRLRRPSCRCARPLRRPSPLPLRERAPHGRYLRGPLRPGSPPRPPRSRRAKRRRWSAPARSRRPSSSSPRSSPRRTHHAHRRPRWPSRAPTRLLRRAPLARSPPRSTPMARRCCARRRRRPTAHAR
ncbi:MAG: hypothetical protein IPJ65_38365 [Archangiaceae bacterium]|nr:hypothetical protein [Archangiaceae bacterium]